MSFSTEAATIPGNEMDAEPGFSSSLLTFAAVMTFIIMIVGIAGNFLTIAALAKCPKVRNVAAAFIISLCLADLIFCALVLPFSALRFIQGTWTHGEVLCKLIPFIQYGNIGVSLLCIAMITINRYVMIAHHSTYGKIYKRHWIAAMIAFCWVFSYGMQLPTLFGVWGKFDYDPKLGTCSIMSDAHGRSSKTALFVTAFIIPCLIIIACYAKIFWVVHESEQRMKEHANKQNSIPNNLRTTPAPSTDNRLSSNAASDSSFSTDAKLEAVQKPSRVKDQREVRAKRNEWRITKMVLAIFLSFLICYLPITIAKVADKDVEHPVCHILSYILLYLSACINPIIYVIMNKQYRKAYKTVLMCEPSRLLPFTKAAAASSAAEKWKDTGLSNNHSRTIVSQMSAADQQNTTSISSSQPATIALELTTKPAVPIRDPHAMPITTKSQQPPQQPQPQQQQQQQQLPAAEQAPVETPRNENGNGNGTANGTFSGSAMNANGNGPAGTANSPPTAMVARATKDSNRIALVGGDIILEEEEEELGAAMADRDARTSPPSSDYVNVAPSKKYPSYGQNINVTPDNNNAKLIAKLKI